MPLWLLITLSSLGYLLIGWAVFVVHAAKFPHIDYLLPGELATATQKPQGIFMLFVLFWPSALLVWILWLPFIAVRSLTYKGIKKLNPELSKGWW